MHVSGYPLIYHCWEYLVWRNTQECIGINLNFLSAWRKRIRTWPCRWQSSWAICMIWRSRLIGARVLRRTARVAGRVAAIRLYVDCLLLVVVRLFLSSVFIVVCNLCLLFLCSRQIGFGCKLAARTARAPAHSRTAADHAKAAYTWHPPAAAAVPLR